MLHGASVTDQKAEHRALYASAAYAAAVPVWQESSSGYNVLHGILICWTRVPKLDDSCAVCGIKYRLYQSVVAVSRRTATMSQRLLLPRSHAGQALPCAGVLCKRLEAYVPPCVDNTIQMIIQ